MTTYSVSLTKLTAPLPQSRGYSCYISRPILTPPPLWLQKHADLRAHDFAHSPNLWHQPKFANVTCACSWRICGITPVICLNWWRCNVAHLGRLHSGWWWGCLPLDWGWAAAVVLRRPGLWRCSAGCGPGWARTPQASGQMHLAPVSTAGCAAKRKHADVKDF